MGDLRRRTADPLTEMGERAFTERSRVLRAPRGRMNESASPINAEDVVEDAIIEGFGAEKPSDRGD